MRKLKIIEHISLDGVLQTTSGPEDDFPYRAVSLACRVTALGSRGQPVASDSSRQSIILLKSKYERQRV